MQSFGPLLLILLLKKATTALAFPVLQANPVSTVRSWYAELMETVCDDLIVNACANRDGYLFRYSVFDPVSRFCVCSTSPSVYMANKKCPDISCPANQHITHYWPGDQGCFCEVQNFFAEWWNVVQHRRTEHAAVANSIFDTEANDTDIDEGVDGHLEPFEHTVPTKVKQVGQDPANLELSDRERLRLHRRQVDPSAPAPPLETDTALPTFIPPPKQDITPALINKSLSLQPQHTAIVGSVIPHLMDEVLTFLVQLAGPIATTISMNASTIFSCGSVGTDPQPDVMLVPKYVRQGTPQTVIANCRCIAVSMLIPRVLTYWVQMLDGTVYSLAGSVEVFDIDKIDTSLPIALSLLPSMDGAVKPRDLQPTDVVKSERRQIFKSVVCDRHCPEDMKPVRGNLLKVPPECGCLAEAGKQSTSLTSRALNQPDAYSATMSEEVCKAMKCINNGDKPAMHNPFDMTCWCPDPVPIEDNSSAWAGSGSKA